MTERHHIEIDYCPQCRGIWLDKGELDKMLQYAGEKLEAGPAGDTSRGQQSFQSQGYQPPQPHQGHAYSQPGHQHDDDDDHHHKYNPKRKKKGFLGDLFDFD